MHAHRTDVSEAERAEWLRQVEEAQRLLDANRPHGKEHSMPYLLGTEAELRQQLAITRGRCECSLEQRRLHR